MTIIRFREKQILSLPPLSPYMMPNMILKLGGLAVADRNPENLQIIYAETEWDKACFLNYACFCFITSIPPHTYYRSCHLLFTQHRLHCSNKKGKAIWCTEKSIYIENISIY